MPRSINPATGAVIAEYAAHAPDEIERRLQSATRGFDAWRSEPAERRADVLRRVAAILRERRDMLAALMTAEVGKPIAASEAEVEKCAGACDHFAESAP